MPKVTRNCGLVTQLLESILVYTVWVQQLYVYKEIHGQMSRFICARTFSSMILIIKKGKNP